MQSLSPRLRELMGTARELSDSVVATNADADDRDARWPDAAMRALASAHLTGLHVPRELGGHGEGVAALVAISEVVGRQSASTALCFAMHCVGTAVLAAKATGDQKARYLEPIARGEHLTTLALSEPGTGAFFYLPQTTLAECDGGFVVNGTKSFITSGGHADSYVVSTTAVPGKKGGEGAFSCVVVDAGTTGLKWLDEWHGLGMRGNSSRTLLLENAPIPAANILGESGDQLWYMFEVVVPFFLSAMAGTYLGVAQAAFDEARDHLGTRRYTHSGELLGSAPVLSHRLGDLWTRLEETRQLIYSAAVRYDRGAPDALAAVLASKAAAADTAVSIANEAMTLCGGVAYRDNSRLARLLRDARASHVMAPTTDILKTWLGRLLLKLPLI